MNRLSLISSLDENFLTDQLNYKQGKSLEGGDKLNILSPISLSPISGVGLPRKAGRNDPPCVLRRPDGSEESKRLKSKPLGWEDIRDLPAGFEIIRTVMDDTLPSGPREKQIIYTAPFDRCNREDDYRQAWAVFEKRVALEGER